MLNHVFFWLKDTANKYPDKIAIWDESGFITYEEYYKKSLTIASEILKRLKNESNTIQVPITVLMKKSYMELVSFAGVACSGNFYSPIDVEMPPERISKIMKVLKPKLIITTREFVENAKILGFDEEHIICYEEVTSHENNETCILSVMERSIDTDLLYVLFTSGSTGTPKGVCISHRSVVDYIDWVTDTFEFKSEDSFGNQAPFYFDNSILDIYSCIKTGATLYIIPSELFRQPVRLLEYLKEKQITTIFWVPSALLVVSSARALKTVDISEFIKRVMFCGEVMPAKHLNIWKQYLPDATYVNLYGPTEITDACTYYIVDREISDDESIPIGYPCKNTSILVLNEDNKLVALNESGELCVRGSSLAKGYYGDIEKTNAVFVQNPLNHCYEDKIYRTGDIVKYNTHGELLYLSRCDHQIKHLGHRIELGEIETVVSSFPEITRCCVLYDDKRKRIVLFLDADLSREEIRTRLKKSLPDYMLPTKVHHIEDFPLTPNGKINRLKLKEML